MQKINFNINHFDLWPMKTLVPTTTKYNQIGKLKMIFKKSLDIKCSFNLNYFKTLVIV